MNIRRHCGPGLVVCWLVGLNCSRHSGSPSPRCANKKGEAARTSPSPGKQSVQVISISIPGGLGRGRNDIHAAAAFVETYFSVHQGEQGPIAACADVFPGDKFRATLADEDTAGGDELSAISFYAESFADAVTSVADAALTFLMCHNLSFDLRNLDLGQCLAVPHGPVKAFAPFHLEGDLLVAAQMCCHRRDHAGLGHGGRTDGNF